MAETWQAWLTALAELQVRDLVPQLPAVGVEGLVYRMPPTQGPPE